MFYVILIGDYDKGIEFYEKYLKISGVDYGEDDCLLWNCLY